VTAITNPRLQNMGDASPVRQTSRIAITGVAFDAIADVLGRLVASHATPTA
jgi:hypothetical protein